MRHLRHAGGSSTQEFDDVEVFVENDSDAILNAADRQQVLLTSEERVDRAIAQTTAGQEFTVEQQAWLDRIRSHLVENLSIDREDFDDLPVFSRGGGWGRANRTFSGRLGDLVAQINEAIAA